MLESMKPALRQGKTLIEFLMDFVAPVVGGVMVGLALRATTSLPTWGCVLISLPVGAIIGWITMLALLLVVERIIHCCRGNHDQQDEQHDHVPEHRP
jgi:tetrahydromethanopterin S-methyltransferase subunit E